MNSDHRTYMPSDVVASGSNQHDPDLSHRSCPDAKDGRIASGFGTHRPLSNHTQPSQAAMDDTDPLTKLLSRAGLNRYMQAQWPSENDSAVSVLYVDLDHFRTVNDDYGRLLGDRVLKAFAARLQSIVRVTDPVARVGGEEFAVVLPGVREKYNAECIADIVVAMAQRPFEIEGQIIPIGASVGVAVDVRGRSSGDRLVDIAEALACQAKRNGCNQYAIADSLRFASTPCQR